MGRTEPLPTTMEEGWASEEGLGEEMWPQWGVVWLVAPESTTQSVRGLGGAGAVELRQPVRNCESDSPNHGVEGDDYCGGGNVNEGPTYCTGKPYWGDVKKVCGVDQNGAPPMHGLKDGQAGVPVPASATGPTCSTRKPYWSAAKKACSVNQYEALPMDGSKNG
jgi:hypothetical protein